MRICLASLVFLQGKDEGREGAGTREVGGGEGRREEEGGKGRRRTGRELEMWGRGRREGGGRKGNKSRMNVPLAPTARH